MSRYMVKFILSCALAGTTAGPVSALAAPAGKLAVQESRKVEYGDLDLSRNAGVATLFSRIKRAAREVCEPMDVVIANLMRERFDCRQDAIARAVADVNAPLLTSYFLEINHASSDSWQR